MAHFLPSRKNQTWIPPSRRARMETLLDAWHARLQRYLPLDTFPAEPRPQFELWAKRWIWQPLSGFDYPDTYVDDAYFALSYVWGNTTTAPPVEIEVDGQPVHVGRNLHDALRALREIPEVQMGTRVWVDALCINQLDLAERNSEVKRMAEIYAGAQRVISWLGEEENLDDDAVDFLHFLSLKDDTFLEKLGEFWLSHPDMVSGEPGAAIARFLSRTYWSRIWILQEVFLARPGSMLLLGARKLHTRNLLQAMRVFELLGLAGKEEIWTHGRSYTVPEARQLEAGLWKVLRTKTLVMRQLDPEVTTEATLADGDLLNVLKALHQNAGNAEARDERDKVYGQLALLDRRIASHVAVDYSEATSFMRVMANLAIAVIKGIGSLDWTHCTWAVILEEDAWPSWIPDFRIGKDGHHYRWASQPGDASGSTVADVDIDPVDLVLKCQGFRVDVITSVTQSLADMALESETEEDSQQTYDWSVKYVNWADHPGQPDRIAGPAILRKKIHHVVQLQKWKNTSSSPPLVSASPTHQYINDAGLQDALRICLERVGWTAAGINILDLVWELDALFDFSALSIYDSARGGLLMQTFRELNKEFDFFGRSFKDMFPTALMMEDEEVEWIRYLAFVENMASRDKMIYESRLVRTQRGFVGAVICDILPGDEVVVLKGCKLPVVVRKVGERYRLVGSAYVHGIMEGEVLEEAERDERREETIVIY